MEKVNLNGYDEVGDEEIIIESRGFACGVLCVKGIFC